MYQRDYLSQKHKADWIVKQEVIKFLIKLTNHDITKQKEANNIAATRGLKTLLIQEVIKIDYIRG